MAGLMVIFDFDKTIIECDSDNWVVDNFGFTDIFNHLLPTTPWNSLMDHMMGEIHSNGISMEDIEQVLQHVPIHPRTVLAIKTAHALGCDLRIVSDANIIFINTILEHLGIKDCFSEINTNPSYVDEEGRLKIGCHNDFRNSFHGCQLCPPNMCKGTVIERIQASLVQEGVNKKRIIYLGDGAGDYCPSLKLNHGDFVMPRKNFPVWELINRNPNLIRAQIHEWTDGEELEQVLLHIIDKVVSEEDNIPAGSRNQMVVDCKLQTISMVSQEALGPAALPVPQ